MLIASIPTRGTHILQHRKNVLRCTSVDTFVRGLCLKMGLEQRRLSIEVTVFVTRVIDDCCDSNVAYIYTF